MNEVIKCSISGIGFTLDTDAYQALRTYLDTLCETYAQTADGKEIVADIEARIAELILTAQENTRVVEKPLIDDILRQMGSAEQIGGDSDEKAGSGDTPRIPRRLYRDAQHAKLGGVCAGLGRYFDVDPVWIRLGIFLPLILSTFRWIPLFGYHWGNLMGNVFAAFILSYIVLWFAIPTARSARQKLEMKGERITARSISETAAQTHDVDGHAKSVLAGVLAVSGQIVLVLLKILIGVIVFGLIVAACALVIGIIIIGVRGSTEIFEWQFSVWTGILGIVAVLVPLILLIYVLMCLIASRKPSGRIVLGIFAAWLLACIVCAVTAVGEYRNTANRSLREATAAPTQIEDNLMNSAVTVDVDQQENPSLRISTPDGEVEMEVGKK